MSKISVILGVVVCHVFLSTDAWGQPTCDIAPQTKQLLEKVLCGQAAQEKAYQQFGPGCFERSATKRIDDTAIQVVTYEKCLDSDFSAELMRASLNFMHFMEALSVCVSETVSLEDIMQERMEFARRKSGTLNCTSSLRSKLQKKRPAFEAMIIQINEIDQAALLAGFGVVIDENGNVSDR